MLRDGYHPPLLVPSGPIVVEVNPIYAGLTEALDIHIAATIRGVFGAVPDRDRPEDGGGVHGPSPGNDPASMIAGWDIGASHHRSRPRRRGTGTIPGLYRRGAPAERGVGLHRRHAHPDHGGGGRFLVRELARQLDHPCGLFGVPGKAGPAPRPRRPVCAGHGPRLPREGRLWKFKLSERNTWVRAGGADSPDDPEAPDSRDDEKG